MSSRRVDLAIVLRLSDGNDSKRDKEDLRRARELTQRVKDVCEESRYAGILDTAPHPYDVGG